VTQTLSFQLTLFILTWNAPLEVVVPLDQIREWSEYL
jgi:hypothetical protein